MILGVMEIIVQKLKIQYKMEVIGLVYNYVQLSYDLCVHKISQSGNLCLCGK